MTKWEFNEFIERVAKELPEGFLANYLGTIYGPGKFNIQTRLYKRVFALRLRGDYSNQTYWLKALAVLIQEGELEEKDVVRNVPVGTSEKETANIICTELFPVAEKILARAKVYSDDIEERNRQVNISMLEHFGVVESPDRLKINGDSVQISDDSRIDWQVRAGGKLEVRLTGLSLEQAVDVARTISGFST